VLNEGGGRELKMFDRLSAQLAYMVVSYRHDPEWIASINRLIEAYVGSRASPAGHIGKGSTIRDSGTLKDVWIGEETIVRGISLLENGTIVSNSEAPSCVGENVIARNFIIQSGSRIDGGALLDKCFVGQGVEIGKQFSAENSVFFANSEAFHGEAVSVFAGPYTVSHHKSTLLIAGMFSFYNAGSGTNQSNHMYKLGPVHQGVLERGSKTGSFAYLLWPCRIGAYTVVMGKNMASFDTSDFPFSYINVDHERSMLTPGMNLFTVGTRRDSEKWRKRDKRKDPDVLDLIQFDLLSPYIMQKVLRSLDILESLYENTSRKQESVFHKGIRIKRLMLKSTRKFYQTALHMFVGDQVAGKLELLKDSPSLEEIRKKLEPSRREIPDTWMDLAGMIASDRNIHRLMADVKSGLISSLEEVSARLIQIHESYEGELWDWTVHVLATRFQLEVERITAAELLELISLWESETIKLNNVIMNDARKEFDSGSKLGFGIDGDQEVADRDFEAVRGTPEQNKFIAGVQEEIRLCQSRAERLKNILQGISG
jgi:hypothetical protein